MKITTEFSLPVRWRQKMLIRLSSSSYKCRCQNEDFKQLVEITRISNSEDLFSAAPVLSAHVSCLAIVCHLCVLWCWKMRQAQWSSNWLIYLIIFLSSSYLVAKCSKSNTFAMVVNDGMSVGKWTLGFGITTNLSRTAWVFNVAKTSELVNGF